MGLFLYIAGSANPTEATVYEVRKNLNSVVQLCRLFVSVMYTVGIWMHAGGSATCWLIVAYFNPQFVARVNKFMFLALNRRFISFAIWYICLLQVLRANQ